MNDTQTIEGLLVTQEALTKISSLLANEEKDLFLRVAVQPGGCAGLRYELYFDDTELDRDVIMTFGDVTVVMDEKSAPYLGGATVDYADTISKQGFIIDNPNAAGTCQCGDSFN